MSHTACTITHVEPEHNPNEGRVIINNNFDCITTAIDNLEIVSATGSTSVSPGTNVGVVLAILSGVPNYTVSVIDNPVFTSISATTISANTAVISVLSADTASITTLSANTAFITTLSANTLDAGTMLSGGTDLYDIFGASGSSNVFTSDITVSLSGGKTVGRYVNGDTIPASGKTAEQVFNLIAREPINPTVNLSSPTTIQFNQTAITNVLNFSYTINSIGATVASVSLDTRRNNAGAWTVLTANTAATTYTHTLTDTAYNAQPFNYRYIVVDSFGASAMTTVNITPTAYVAPSIAFSAPATTLTSPEVNQTREKGNISSVLQGSVTRNSPLVNVQSYELQYSLNGGGYVSIGTSGLTAAGGTITAFTHNDVSLVAANNITYRTRIVDDFQTTISSTYLITFLNLIFYAPVSAQPITSSAVRALTNRIFTTGSNPFNLNTGAVEKIFTVAMPATLSISSVLDLDALNANITANYVLSTFNVDDYFGNPVSYKVYTMTNAIPYAANHRHQVTR